MNRFTCNFNNPNVNLLDLAIGSLNNALERNDLFAINNGFGPLDSVACTHAQTNGVAVWGFQKHIKIIIFLDLLRSKIHKQTNGREKTNICKCRSLNQTFYTFHTFNDGKIWNSNWSRSTQAYVYARLYYTRSANWSNSICQMRHDEPRLFIWCARVFSEHCSLLLVLLLFLLLRHTINRFMLHEQLFERARRDRLWHFGMNVRRTNVWQIRLRTSQISYLLACGVFCGNQLKMEQVFFLCRIKNTHKIRIPSPRSINLQKKYPKKNAIKTHSEKGNPINK